ncbi:MAG TPA: hypothetical protein VGI76_09485 [Solirubrobacteraceae bacterium]
MSTSLAVLAASMTFGGLAQADTFASIAPSLVPNRLHARAALTFTIHFGGGELGVPAPVRRAVLHLPADLTLNIPQLRICNPTRLQVFGPDGCPARSLIGHGYALVEGELGTETVTEHVSMLAFLGPPRNLQPTFVIFVQGYRPISAQMVLPATSLADSPPYGEDLVMEVPPISTVPTEPDASVITFSLTIGRPHSGRFAPTVVPPAHCPPGGLPFAAEFTYADGSTGRALTTSPCPK